MAIKSFADKATEKIFYGKQSSSKARCRLPVSLWDKAHEIFDALDAVKDLRDLRIYDLSQKKGDRAGQFSLNLNAQYRICFEWDNGDAGRVEVVDYH
jgi:proteic killer suppression protein